MQMLRKHKFVYCLMVFLFCSVLMAQTAKAAGLTQKETKAITKVLKEYNYTDQQIEAKINTLTDEQVQAIHDKMAGEGFLAGIVGGALAPMFGYVLAFMGIVALDMWWENKTLDEI